MQNATRKFQARAALRPRLRRGYALALVRPNFTNEDYQRAFAGRHLLHGVVAHWASLKPRATAIVACERDREIDWETLDRSTSALAAELLRRGFSKGDFLATSLPFTLEHIFLEYACFKIGVIHAPLDLRLRPPEVARCLGMIRPRGYFALKAELREAAGAIEHFLDAPGLEELVRSAACQPLRDLGVTVSESDGAQVIFTTGSTGSPKPALLSHRNITCQNMCLGGAFGFGERCRVLVNLPPSHVGGQAEALMTALFWGGVAVTLPVFDPARSLAAIRDCRVTLIGQIPAMFNLEWRLSDYSSYDLSSLEVVVYGGQQVSRPFLERLAEMAPTTGTGLGLTETAGFCTYTSSGDLAESIGYEMPVYSMSIREPMREDGSAGRELPDGEVGQVCFRGPQTFLGYVGDPEATRRAISADGYLYTGDMGSRDAQGLHFAGRAKWVIKPAGYQVFPGDVENHLCGHPKVAACGAVGAEHATFTEAIVAFVEQKPGADLTVQELRRHARGMASYMRPLHYVLLEPGAMPLNRVVKTDYVRLSEMARQEVERLRSLGRWDR